MLLKSYDYTHIFLLVVKKLKTCLIVCIHIYFKTTIVTKTFSSLSAQISFVLTQKTLKLLKIYKVLDHFLEQFVYVFNSQWLLLRFLSIAIKLTTTKYNTTKDKTWFQKLEISLYQGIF